MSVSRKRLRIGLVGYGSIGKQVARRLATGDLPGAQLIGIVSRSMGNTRTDLAPRMNLEECISRSDVVVEAATAEIVPRIIQLGAAPCKAVIILSGCALVRWPDLRRQADLAGLQILLPSGAVAGLDAALAASEEASSEIRLIIRRPCAGIENVSHVVNHSIDLDQLTGETLIFEGTPLEACMGFEGRTNISASVALAGIGNARTRVQIYADPGRTMHEHHLIVHGRFGKAESRVEFDASQPAEIDSIMTLSVLAAIRSLMSSTRYAT